jgi:hypothetical protein
MVKLENINDIEARFKSAGITVPTFTEDNKDLLGSHYHKLCDIGFNFTVSESRVKTIINGIKTQILVKRVVITTLSELDKSTQISKKIKERETEIAELQLRIGKLESGERAPKLSIGEINDIDNLYASVEKELKDSWIKASFMKSDENFWVVHNKLFDWTQYKKSLIGKSLSKASKQ